MPPTRISTFMSDFAQLRGEAGVKDSMVIERAVVDGNAIVVHGAVGGVVHVSGLARVAGAARCFEYDPFVYEVGGQPPFDIGDEPMILTVCDAAVTLFPKSMTIAEYDPDEENKFVFSFDRVKSEHPALWPLVERVIVRRIKAQDIEGRADFLDRLEKEGEDAVANVEQED